MSENSPDAGEESFEGSDPAVAKLEQIEAELIGSASFYVRSLPIVIFYLSLESDFHNFREEVAT